MTDDKAKQAADSWEEEMLQAIDHITEPGTWSEAFLAGVNWTRANEVVPLKSELAKMTEKFERNSIAAGEWSIKAEITMEALETILNYCECEARCTQVSLGEEQWDYLVGKLIRETRERVRGKC